MNMMIWIWLGAIVVFGIVEAMTAGLVSIWFAAGALASLVCALLDLNLTVQIVIFLVVSIITLALTRPLVKKYQNGKTVPTNADRVLGCTAKVTAAVDNENSTGAVYINGKTWTARSTSGDRISVGQMVCVDRMEGVKLYVHQIEETEENAV